MCVFYGPSAWVNKMMMMMMMMIKLLSVREVWYVWWRVETVTEAAHGRRPWRVHVRLRGEGIVLLRLACHHSDRSDDRARRLPGVHRILSTPVCRHLQHSARGQIIVVIVIIMIVYFSEHRQWQCECRYNTRNTTQCSKEQKGQRRLQLPTRLKQKYRK